MTQSLRLLLLTALLLLAGSQWKCNIPARKTAPFRLLLEAVLAVKATPLRVRSGLPRFPFPAAFAPFRWWTSNRKSGGG